MRFRIRQQQIGQLKERAFLTSLGFVGVPLGAVLTAPVAVLLLSFTSWKVMFFILGTIGIVWAIIWYFTFTNMPEDHPRVTKEELAEIRSTEGVLQSVKVERNSKRAMVFLFKFRHSLWLR